MYHRILLTSEIDDAEQEDRPVAELEHVPDLDGRRQVGHAEVVARATVDADRDQRLPSGTIDG
jgi:hypothetical protein